MTATAATCTGLPGSASEAPPPSALKMAVQRSGRFFGMAARMDLIESDTRLREIIISDCTSLTAEYHMNWDHLNPLPGQSCFGPADRLAAFAAEQGMLLRGHSLLWDQSTPAWAREQMRERRDWKTVSDYFGLVMPRFGAAEWDVVNECIDVNGRSDGLRENTFLASYGPDYIARAFETARDLAPGTRLKINEYGLEYGNREEAGRRRHFLALLEKLKSRAVPVDGVGLQAHLDLSKGPLQERGIADFLANIAAMGYPIVITELDVKETDTSGRLDLRDARVADHVKAYLEVVLAERAVEGIVTWGCGDRDSWLQDRTQREQAGSHPSQLNRGLPYDAFLRPKPMHMALEQAFRFSSTRAKPTDFVRTTANE